MKSIKFENGDICITSKRLQMVNDINQKMQKTRTILLTVLGELFYDTSIGLDYSEILSINDINITTERRKMAIISALLQDENVEKVDSITIENNTKKRSVNVTAKIKYKQYDEIIELGGVSIE